MNTNINVLVDIKREYTTELVSMLAPCIYEGIQSIYADGKSINKNNSNILRTFQNLLSQIPKWNTSILEQETTRIKNKCNCEWLHELIQAVIISNTIVLSNSNKKNISEIIEDINVTTEEFIHTCYIEVARELFKNPYLLYDGLKPWEKQSNMRESHKIIKDSIEESIRKMLPFGKILKAYLKSDFVNEDHKSESIMEPISDARKQNIGNLVRRHIRDDIFDILGGGEKKRSNVDNNFSEEYSYESCTSDVSESYTNSHSSTGSSSYLSSDNKHRHSKYSKHNSLSHKNSSHNRRSNVERNSSHNRRSNVERNSHNKQLVNNDEKQESVNKEFNKTHNQERESIRVQSVKNNNINDINELSENILVKQTNNNANFDLLESIRENDIKNNTKIDIAEIYSNRNNSVNLIDNNTDNNSKDMK